MASIELWGADYCQACKDAKAHILSTDPAGHGVGFSYVDKGEESIELPQTYFVMHDGSYEFVQGYDKTSLDAKLTKLYGQVASKPISSPTPVGQHDAQGLIGIVFAVLGFVGFSLVKKTY